MSAESALQRFQALVLRRLGLHFSEDRLNLLDEALRRGLLESGQAGPEAYLQSLEQDGPALERLAEALTVTETYFFRHPDQLRALSEAALPARIQARAGQRRLRLLSAGCASGEEAYTLAILLGRQAGLAGWDLAVRGVDINAAALGKAREGLYATWSLRESSEADREACFVPQGRAYRIRDGFRSQVSFERRNLSEPNADLWRPGEHDVIFCRNMLMYLGPEQAIALVARMAASLAPGGFLFLGSAETLRGLSQDFHLCHTHDSFYYQRLDGPPRRLMPSEAPPALAPLAWDPDLTWVEAIQGAAERIESLAQRAAQAPVPVPAQAGPSARGGGLERAMELLRGERFSEALAALPREADQDAQLLRAALLLNLGRLDEAEQDCRSLLRADELNAGAHYLTALCREQAGDLEAAQEQDRLAVHLDARFAMPWLHLGLLARRRGGGAQARQHLERALALLEREDSARVLLFGGGFGREGLIQLCRRSLNALEAMP